jgi:hypothetical protein
MHPAVIPLGSLLAFGSLLGPAVPDAPVTRAPEPVRISVAILVSGPLPYRELDDALRIRLPRLRTLPFEDRSFRDLEGEPYAYVELSEPSAPVGAIDITVILTDGRSYGRRFVPEENDRVRDTATMLANTITAIEEERVQPVRRDAEIPLPPPEAPPEEVPPPDEVASKSPSPRAEPPRWMIGVTPAAGTVLGLAPRPVGSFGGGAVALGLLARAPVGVAFGLGLRYATRLAGPDVRLSRIRALVAVGYAYRRRSFELLALGGFTVEPWLLSRTTGSTRPAVTDDAPIGPLLGGIGRLSPGLLVQPAATPSFALRLGLFAELAGSGIARNGTPRIVAADGAGELVELARFGGLELSTGLDVALWFSLPAR